MSESPGLSGSLATATGDHHASEQTACNSGAPSAFAGLGRKMAQYVPGAVVPAAIGLLSSVVFTRLLHAGEYGRFSVVVSLVTASAALLSQPLQQGITRFLPGMAGGKAAVELKTAVGVSLLGFVMLTVVAACSASLSGWTTTNIGAEWQPLVWPGFGLFLVTAISGPLTAILQAEVRAKRHTTYSVLGVVLKFGLSLLLVLAWTRAPASLVAAGVLSQAVIIVPMWRDAGVLPSLRGRMLTTTFDSLKRMLRYGLPMAGYCAAASLLAVGDRYVIQYFRGETEVGVYAANYSLVSWGVGLATAPVLLAAHPFFMKAWGNGNRGEAATWLGIITELYLILGALLVAGLAVFSGDVAFIALGQDYREGHHIMPIVLAGVIAWQIAMYTHKPLEFAGRTTWIFGLSAAAAALNVAANVWLVPKFGYVVAAYTTLGSYCVYAACTAALGQRVITWSVCWRRVIEFVVVIVLALGTTQFIRTWIAARGGYLPGLAAAVLGSAVTTMVIGRRILSTYGTRRATPAVGGCSGTREVMSG